MNLSHRTTEVKKLLKRPSLFPGLPKILILCNEKEKKLTYTNRVKNKLKRMLGNLTMIWHPIQGGGVEYKITNSLMQEAPS